MGAGTSSAMGRAIGRLCLASAARPKAALAAIAALTLVMGAGMLRLETEADLLDILPRGNPHTEAAHNASEGFRGFYDLVTVFYRIDEAKCRRVSDAQLPYRASAARCGNVTDEAYVRGMEEVWRFIQGEIPAAEYAIDLAGIVKTVNWTNSGYFGDPRDAVLGPLLGGDPQGVGRPVDSAFSMPGTDPAGELMYEAAWRGANAADESVNDVVAPTFAAGRTLVFFNASASLSRVELGREVYRAVDAYAAAVRACDDGDPATECRLRWNVFSDEGLAVRGVASLDAHASDVTQRDINRLAPLVVVALVLILYASFRDARVVLVAGVDLLVAFLWTAGLMGWLAIPFSALNLTIIPLILGVGIDYAIHMVSEHLDHKAQGLTDTQAFQRAGNLSGVALLIATATTVAGLLLMALSPSLLMAQLAVVGSIALTVCFAFALTLIPALLALTAPRVARRPEKGSASILALCGWVGRHRAAGWAAVVLLSAASAVGARSLAVETFGNPELNYPPGDRVRDDLATINDLFFGGQTDTQSNYLIVEGDLTRPEAHRFLDNLTANLAADETLQAFNTASLTRVVRAWVTIDQGTPDAVVNQLVLGQLPEGSNPASQYPRTQEEIRATFDAIFASPFANFMTVLLGRDGYGIGMVSFDTRQGLDFKEAERVWTAAQAVIQATYQETGYRDLQVHQFGSNAVSYLFVEEELPWVQDIGLLSFAAVTAMIGAMTRSWRATLATATIMAVTSLWWLATLPALGIGLSVGLMLPLVFISAIGSDNAVHLIWNLEHLADRRRVYRHVGKAVFLTMATDAAAFLVFSFQTDLLVRRTMLATVSSVTVMWVATMLVVPLLYPPPPAAAGAPRPAPPPTLLEAGADPATKRI